MEQYLVNKSVEILNVLKKDFCKDDAEAIVEITKILIKCADITEFIC